MGSVTRVRFISVSARDTDGWAMHSMQRFRNDPGHDSGNAVSMASLCFVTTADELDAACTRKAQTALLKQPSGHGAVRAV